MLGHAHAVAELAARAAVEHGLPELATTMRRAGFVHDLGRLGISNAIWDKRGPLGPGEWERVEEVYEAGDAFYLTHGHIPRAEPGTEYLQFSPAEELHIVSAQMQKNMAAMQGA
jgi:hypothetical protein